MIRTVVTAALAVAIVLTPAAAGAVDPSLDSDQDGWYSGLEEALGADPDDDGSTPETFAIGGSCDDGADNDGDGTTDLDDDGCTIAPVITGEFPPAGKDIFSTRMELRDFALVTPLGLCRVTFDGDGPAIIDRSDPTGDDAPAIDLIIEAMQLDGFAILLPNSPCNRTANFRRFPATVVEAPAKESTGRITAGNADAHFPADSFFDIFIAVDTPLGVLTGAPEGEEPGDALRVTNEIRSLPPFFSPRAGLNPSCYAVPGEAHRHCPTGELDHLTCYSGSIPQVNARDITLSDHVSGEFEATTGALAMLCNPASKAGGAIADPGGHLTFYNLSGDTPPVGGTIMLDNQFAEFELPLTGLSGLFVPTRKGTEDAPLVQDHFSCYGVPVIDFGRDVTVQDQWIDAVIPLDTPEVACVVAAKQRDGQEFPPSDPGRSLLCFDVEIPIEPQTTELANQFDQLRATFDRLEWLCVPSLRAFELAGAGGGTIALHANDTTRPTVTLVRLGTDDEGRTVLRFDVQDTGSGLDRIHVRAPLEGVEVEREEFTPPTNRVVSVTVRKDPGVRASVSVWGVDWVGNFREGDPTWVELRGGDATTVEDIPAVERTVTVTNGDPGLATLDVAFRDGPPRTLALRPGQEVSVSFDRPGAGNHWYAFEATGPGQATVMIWDGAALAARRPGGGGRPIAA